MSVDGCIQVDKSLEVTVPFLGNADEELIEGIEAVDHPRPNLSAVPHFDI